MGGSGFGVGGFIPHHTGKTGPRYLPSNYRPVSLTSVACKVLEHIIHSNIMRHFDQFNILTDKQHGFRKRRSTASQLIATIQGITSKLDQERTRWMLSYWTLQKPLIRYLIKGFCISSASMESVEITSNGLKHSMGTGSSKCYWMGVDLNKLMSSLECHREQFWVHCCSWHLKTTSLNLSKPPILASLLRTACCTSSSAVMLMQNQSNKIFLLWRNGKESGK